MNKQMFKKISLIFLSLCLALTGCSTLQPQPKTDQIKADLIGHALTVSGTQVWQFAALSEYEQLNITSNQTQANVVEYDISMRLVDLATNTHFTAEIAVVYRQEMLKWELISIVTKSFKQVTGGRNL
jgi:hypothetical protein